MRKLRKEANDAGAGINDKKFITALLDSFPGSWDPIVSTLYGEVNITKVISCLVAHGKQVVSRNGPMSTQETSIQTLQASIQALTLQVQNLSSPRKSTNAHPDKSHAANNNCKGIGHTLDECWKLGRGRQGQYPAWWKGKRDAPLPSANLIIADTSSSAAGSITTNVITLNAYVDGDLMKEIEEKTQESEAALVVNNSSPGLDKSRMYGDSGASTHFVQNRDLFFNYVPLGDTSGTSSKVGALLNVLGTGTVAMKPIGSESIITFSRTLHCPDMSANLLSISQLDKEGWSVTFSRGKASFADQNGNPQFTATMSNDLYAINGTLIHGEEYTALSTRSLEASCYDLFLFFT